MTMIAKLEWKVMKTKRNTNAPMLQSYTNLIIVQFALLGQGIQFLEYLRKGRSCFWISFYAVLDQRTEVLRAPCRDFRPVILIKDS